jgi:hypothetical protein
VTAKFGGDTFYLPSSDSSPVFVFATATGGGGSFVIGDKVADPGNQVTFWGAQWWKLNPMTGAPAPAAFKGFAASTQSNPPKCGEKWTTRPGNSSDPPPTVPSYMAVIVSSSISKSGSTITGDVRRVVIVKTDPGYGPDPGHAGTGKVVAELCHS